MITCGIFIAKYRLPKINDEAKHSNRRFDREHYQLIYRGGIVLNKKIFGLDTKVFTIQSPYIFLISNIKFRALLLKTIIKINKRNIL